MGSPGPQGPSGGASGGGGNVTGDLNTAGAVHVNGLGGKLGRKPKQPAAKATIRKPVSTSTRKGKR